MRRIACWAQAHAQATAFILCFAILLWRGADRLGYAHLWAEDGAVFLSSSLHTGWAALSEPYAGYFHTIPRLLALATLRVFPLAWFPHVIALACYGITAAAFATVASADYREVVPSDGARVIAACAFCFATGLLEVLGNLTNLHWILYVYVWFLALKPARNPLTGYQLGAIVLSALSAGEVIVTLPLFAVRAWLRRRESPAWDAAAVAVVLAAALLNLAHREAPQQAAVHDFVRLLETGLVTLSSSVLFEPLVGADRSASLRGSMNLWSYSLWGTLVAGALATALLRRRRAAGLVLAFAFACAFLVPVLAWFVRPASIDLFRTVFKGRDWWGQRYAFMMAIPTLMLWVGALRPHSLSEGWRRWAFLALMCLFASNSLAFTSGIGPYGREHSWSQQARELQTALDAGCPRVVNLRIYPQGWGVRYEAPANRATCP